MSAPAHAVPDSPAAAARTITPLGRFYWSVRRELWENRYLYIAPAAVGVLILLGSLFNLVDLPDKLRAASVLDAAKQHEAFERPYTFASLLLMFATILAAVFYCLDALYGERRDRAVLFWKSLPVSDLTTVLAKASIPCVVIPLITWAATVATQSLMLLMTSIRLTGTGLSLWGHLPFGKMTWILFYHLLVGHGLWYAPFWGWFLLCSAWSRRTPYLWATLPPLAVVLVERIAFNTSYFGGWLAHRFMVAPGSMQSHDSPMTIEAMTPTPVQFATSSGFWLGLALTAAFLAAAVHLRRRQTPI